VSWSLDIGQCALDGTTHAHCTTIACVSLYGQEPEAALIGAFLPKLGHRTVIDVGGEQGAFAEAMLQAGADAVHVIEPEPHNVAVLLERFVADPRVTVHGVAASDADRTLELHISTNPDGAPIPFGHTVLERPGTDEIAWRTTVSVEARSLESLVAAGEVPGRVGVLKIDTEGHDDAVIAGIGPLDCDVLVVEHWVDLPNSLGRCPWTLGEVATPLRARGFSHFAFIQHRSEFTILTWDDGEIPPGHMGNIVFLHDRVVDRLVPDLLMCASQLAVRSVLVGEMYATAAAERLELIEQLDRALKQQT
jgi:FkbM family methyltransferase